ncbi:hypothetical protein [Melghirimyces profundicolus]|uniref:hypothetical protein n=1 Tax=Melghirimyces profundicolus TaxID=1242148 RepID=UPI0011B262BA|nr:hypothetical protein [Melghirimyces profundicolus]
MVLLMGFSQKQLNKNKKQPLPFSGMGADPALSYPGSLYLEDGSNWVYHEPLFVLCSLLTPQSHDYGLKFYIRTSTLKVPSARLPSTSHSFSTRLLGGVEAVLSQILTITT